jgi:hypothetical protein
MFPTMQDSHLAESHPHLQEPLLYGVLNKNLSSENGTLERVEPGLQLKAVLLHSGYKTQRNLGVWCCIADGQAYFPWEKSF